MIAHLTASFQEIRQIIRMMEEGTLHTDTWIVHRAPFEDMIEQFEQWLKPEAQVIKAVVEL